MAGFDRSKLKATTSAALQKQAAEIATKRPSLNGGEKNYLEIKVGENKFRIFPYHPDGGGSSFAEAKCVSFLPLEVPKRDEKGKLIEGQTEIKMKPIFNSKVHGNYKYDLVETYMEVAKNIAIPNFTSDQDTVKKIWSKITGNHVTKEQGVKPQDSWVVYACMSQGKDESGNDIWGNVGLLELKKSVKDAMTEKALELETPDPFSDPDEGIAVIVTKAKEAKKPEDWYKVKLDNVKKGYSVSYVPTPLTNAQLESWIKLPSLHKLFVNSFKRSDLDYQLKGLERLDNKLKAEGFPINVWQYEEFVNVANEMLDLVPEDIKEEDKELPFEESEKEVETTQTTTKKLVLNNTTNTVVEKNVVKTKEVKEQPKEEEEVSNSSLNDRLKNIRNRVNINK